MNSFVKKVLYSITQKLLSKVLGKSERTRRAFLTGISNGGVVLISLIISFVSVPITIHYLGSERYGLWMTITGMVAILSFADLGLGNGVLNFVSTSYGNNNLREIKIVVSTASFILVGIATLFAVGGIIIYYFVPWTKVFNVESQDGIREAAPAMLVVLLVFAINIPLGIVQKILLGFQQGYIYSLWQIFGNILNFFFLLVSVYLLKAGLVIILIMFSSGNIISSILCGGQLFMKYGTEISPNIKYYNAQIAIKLLKTGGLFLFIQIASILSVSADNIIIAQYCGLGEVANYAIVVKLFSVGPILLSMFIFPLWPAFAEALAKQDKVWIKKIAFLTIRYSVIISIIISIPSIIFGNEFLKLWTGGKVTVSFVLLLWSGIWAILKGYGISLTAILNGLSVLKEQTIIVSLFGLVSIAIKLLVVKKTGIEGIVIITSLSWIVFSAIPSYLLVLRTFKKHMAFSEAI